jgi:hypothetical protein
VELGTLWGVAINAGRFVYSILLFGRFWKNGSPVDASPFNWSVVMFFAVVIISMIEWLVRARKVFKDLVVIVQGQM